MYMILFRFVRDLQTKISHCMSIIKEGECTKYLYLQICM